MEVFKTPGKLRGKTPRSARKNVPRQVCSVNSASPKDMALTCSQPLGDILNAQNRASPALQSLKSTLQKSAPGPPKFHIAEDAENISPIRSPAVKSPVPRALFTQHVDSPDNASPSEAGTPLSRVAISSVVSPLQWSPQPSTQDTMMGTQESTQVFSQQHTQSTQPTQATQSFRRSIQTDDERRDTGESFVSAKEAFSGKDAANHALRDEMEEEDAMDVDDDKPNVTGFDAQDTVIRNHVDSTHEPTTVIHHEAPQSPQEPRVFSEQYSISAETQEALDTANHRANLPEPKNFIGIATEEAHPASDPAAQNDETVLHHDIEDQMDVDDDVRSPSDGSSPVKPLVRKSSLTFASLPAREPLLAKKSMGNRVSRVSHVDQNKSRNSQLGRFTGGKSLGGSQYTQMLDANDEEMDVDQERPGIRREESETTKMHNSASTRTLKERFNMLNQRHEPLKQATQNIITSQPSQSSQPPPAAAPLVSQTLQPTYPHLAAGEPDEDEDDDWISPIRTNMPVSNSNPARPVLSKSFSADTRPVAPDAAVPAKSISVSNPSFAPAAETSTPVASPASKRYMDAPLSASKAKFYSALRAAKEKIIGSSATSAQVKLDALAEASSRPKLQAHGSSDDIFNPERNDKAGTSIFSHLRSPSKESLKNTKSSKLAGTPGSPIKDTRRTRSSSERERKEKDTHEKETKQKQRAEDRLKEIREKEQAKAAAHYQKTKAVAKTPVPLPQSTVKPGPSTTLKTPVAPSQPPQSRLGVSRMNTGTRQQDPDSADEMPPPPPPKGLLPTGAGQKLREPKRLLKAPSKETLPKGKPQKIQVNLHRDRFGQAPAASKPAPTPISKVAPPAVKPAPPSTARPTAASRIASTTAKPAPRMGRTQALKAAEKPKPVPAPAQSRSDLASTRPVSRMQTMQDASRINVPPVNPAKPPAKRPFQADNDESLHRPAKRPSQQARSKPVTPAHAQFAQGKIPFAEPAQPAQPTIQYANSEDIKLPDILTDSEDEDSENEFEQPDWVNTPNLRDMLAEQQLVDPEQIFGPIPPLNMEQVFPNKERHKRFRERTSSAYWAHDQVTEEERRKEREARERLVREGAWTYNPSPRPGAAQ